MKPRNKSLDLFRGFTVLLMVIVNNPGNWGQIYSFFKHAAWDGLGSSDFVFPFFLIAVGASIPFAYAKRKSLAESDARILFHVFLRASFLICIGLLLNGFPDYKLSELRIPGVLQRIGVVYFFAYAIYLSLNFRLQFFLFVSILLSYTIGIVYLAPPDWKYVQNVPFRYDSIYNWAAYIDRSLLSGHLWKITKVWDPEGILSTIPSIASALMGIWISEWFIKAISVKVDLTSKEKFQSQRSIQAISNFLLRLFPDNEKKEYFPVVVKFFFVGIFFLTLGFFVHSVFPINKSLWSSSFVLVTGASAYFFILILYFIPASWQDAKVLKPILMLGQSALFVFVFTGLFSRILNLVLHDGKSTKQIVFSTLSIFSQPKDNSLFYSLVYLCFTICITYIWRKITQRI